MLNVDFIINYLYVYTVVNKTKVYFIMRPPTEIANKCEAVRYELNITLGWFTFFQTFLEVYISTNVCAPSI